MLFCLRILFQYTSSLEIENTRDGDSGTARKVASERTAYVHNRRADLAPLFL